MIVTAQPGPKLEGGKTTAKPRLGFLGVGWIGRNRLEAIARSGIAEIAAISDPLEANSNEARKVAPKAELADGLSGLLDCDLDGIVIATPSALHAEQSIAALENGISVFCQKPLARTGPETKAVVEAARKSDRLLGVDLSYRGLSGIRKIREILQRGELGNIFAIDLVFHNAYGPDKPWFYDPKLSGGGCVIDLGIHLVDLAFWLLGGPRVSQVTSRLFANGKPLFDGQVEDYATARIDLQNGGIIQLACSWKLQAGQDAIISGSFYGTKGGAQFRNVNGSFYEFRAEQFRGTQGECLFEGQEDWGGRAAVEWARRLSEDNSFDQEIDQLVGVADTLDKIYGR